MNFFKIKDDFSTFSYPERNKVFPMTSICLTFEHTFVLKHSFNVANLFIDVHVSVFWASEQFFFVGVPAFCSIFSNLSHNALAHTVPNSTLVTQCTHFKPLPWKWIDYFVKKINK